MLLALMAWAGGLAGFLWPVWLTGVVFALSVVLVLVRRRARHPVLVLSACLAAAAAVAGSAMLRAEANQHNLVAALARQEAFATVEARVTSDPLLRQGQYEPFVLVRAQVVEVTGRGQSQATRVPVLIIGDRDWRRIALGSRLVVEGRLSPPDGRDLAAVISTSRDPTVVGSPGDLLDAAATVRGGIRAAVGPVRIEERTLIPALVVGDDQQMPADLVEDFQVSGLTHLSAVSGTNLTLVVGFVLILARWAGVRARGLVLIGALGVVGFVILARTEPSVVRAAAMGSVALIGMGSNGREKGVRALGVAVFGLLLFDPWLAMSLGFVLSALATAGILFFAPPWRDALMRWLPRWVAEGVSVPLAAQLVCTPVIAAISDQVSLVAVVANMLVAPAVGPATVLGLVGGLLMLVADPVGLLCGRLAGWCAWWIVSVAQQGARMPTAAVDWSAGWLSITMLCLLCLACALAMPRLLARRRWSLLVALLMLVAVVRPMPTIGWPPPDWVMVACDVGQGDGVVLNGGHGSVLVVDTGPDPAVIDRCLDRLGVERVPAVVLTHFHADHVAGLSGVVSGREVGEIAVTALEEPAAAAAEVAAWGQGEGVPVRVPVFGEMRRLGDLTWQVIGPSRVPASDGHGEDSSDANNASVALLVAVRGARILLAGDMEPEAQRLMSRTIGQLGVDVLKVPHHGSRYQDEAFLSQLGARLAVISVGEGNDYGHPAPETIRLLQHLGMLVRRTDESGDIAVVVDDGRLRVVTSEGVRRR
ncbi:MAG TPA: ComEC/Rec2 family competence protein [Nocardioidaceae bacterium]|nr:ComEC/Rec2 family competence protein [Nocardioidaceae bacterium]